jgi:hypothetical protein
VRCHPVPASVDVSEAENLGREALHQIAEGETVTDMSSISRRKSRNNHYRRAAPTPRRVICLFIQINEGGTVAGRSLKS